MLKGEELASLAGHAHDSSLSSQRLDGWLNHFGDDKCSFVGPFYFFLKMEYDLSLKPVDRLYCPCMKQAGSDGNWHYWFWPNGTCTLVKFYPLSHLRKQTANEFCLTLYTMTSVCIFSLLVSIHFLMCLQREFVEQSRGSSVNYHSLYSHDFDVWFMGDIERRNWMLVTQGLKD